MHPNQIILASGNQKKLNELSDMLQRFSIDVVPQSQFFQSEAVEDGLTFVENAIIKARFACRQTGKPAIADDSGIEVDYLKGSPGIYSARFAGEPTDDQANLQKLLKELTGVEKKERRARYQCVIVYMRHAEDPTPIICQADWPGEIIESPRGEGGFGYDPIFFCPVSGKTAAQMRPEEKASISHRGKALTLFKHAFQSRYS